MPKLKILPNLRHHIVFPMQTRIVSRVPNMTSMSASRGTRSKNWKLENLSSLLFKLDAIYISKMPHCMVPMCTNGWRKTKGTDISYHRLPSGPLKSVWL